MKMKKHIEFRQLGQNIILTVDGEQLTKRFADKQEREAVKTAVNDYNELPKSRQTVRDLNAIKDMMNKEDVKSSTKKSTKAAPRNKTISGKQMGQNIILVIDGNKHSKRFPNQDERKETLDLVKKYNEKNTKIGLARILEAMNKDTSTGTEKVKKDIDKMSKSENAPVSTSKSTSSEEIAKAKKLLEDNEYTVSKKTSSSSRTPTKRAGREY